MTHKPESTPAIDEVRTRWIEQLVRGEAVFVEDLLDDLSEESPSDLSDLVLTELALRRQRGERPTLEEYSTRFPALTDWLVGQFSPSSGDTTSILQADNGTPPDPQPSTIAISEEKLSEAETPTEALPGAVDPSAQTILESKTTPEQHAPTDEALPEQIGNYEILGELGRGGMGVVYKARQKGLDRLVALKMILLADHSSAEDRERFEREAQTIARLDHPNFVRIFESGIHSGKPYFTLEFVQGGNLEERLDGTPMEPIEAAAIIETLARAIHVAHEVGVIHRDLKPANVLLTENLTSKITDFGLAKQMEESGQTASGTIMGTPSYMAPEQAKGSRELGPRVDVYALGAILYECLTGHPPFRAPTAMDTIFQVIAQEPVPPRRLQPTIPKDIETICLKCLQKEPYKRYENAEQLADDLLRFQKHEPIQARPISIFEKSWRWCRRRPMIAGLSACLALTLVAGLVIGTTLWNEAEAEHQRNEHQRRMVRVLSEVVLDKTLDETDAWLSQFFDPIEEELRIARNWGIDGILDEDDTRRLNLIIGPLLEHHPQICSMMIADEHGREHMLTCQVDSSERAWSCRLTDREAWGDEVKRFDWKNDLPQPKTMKTEKLDYDPRTRPWFRGAIGQGKPTPPERRPVFWTKPYSFFTLQELGITASTMFRDEQAGDVVVAFDVLLEDISKFTTTKRPTRNGRVLILTGEGKMIGLPSSFRSKDEAAWKSAFLRTPAEWKLGPESDALKQFALGREKAVQIKQFDRDGKKWWAGLRPFTLGSSLTLWMLIVIPESDLHSHL